MLTRKIFTVGHSINPIEKFLRLLEMHYITALADVRSSPYSRLNPQYNQKVLQQSLKRQGISYVFLGKELGARSDNPNCYKEGKIQFSRLADTELFKQGIERITKGVDDHKIALMCAEKEPLSCHRAILVSRELEKTGLSVAHIHSDGHLETHDDAMTRLLSVIGIPEFDLFSSREQLVEEACALQEQRIAYFDERFSQTSKIG